MVYCMAVGCNNDARRTKGKGISYHSLPKNEQLRKEWLAKINRVNPTISKNSFVCSDHFTPECFETNLKAQLTGVRMKTKLKAGAVPTVFTYRPPPKKPCFSTQLRNERLQKKQVRTYQR